MALITDVRQQKRQQHRLSLFVDGQFWSGIDGQLFLDLGLSVGQVLDEEALDGLRGDIARRDGFLLGARCLEMRMFGREELRSRLVERYELDEAIAGMAIDRLTELGLLDDEAYASAWARRCEREGHGPGRLRERLRERLVAPALVDEQAAWLAEREEGIADGVVSRRWEPADLARADIRRKALATLVRRGFSMGVAERVIRERASDDPADRWVPEEPLVRVLRQRYSPLTDPANRQRAWGFLARRGAPSEQIRRLLGADADAD